MNVKLNFLDSCKQQSAMALVSFKRVGEDHGNLAANIEADEFMVNLAGTMMKEKLSKARDKGRGGWWDKEQCSIDSLKHLLKEHVEKGDMIDVLNIAAMIQVRTMGDSI